MLIAHADWSVDARKRWVAMARAGGGAWRVAAPVPVGDVGTFIARLREDAAGNAVALGIDLPLGLPRAYAAALSEPDFPHFLATAAARPDFFRVCPTLAEVAPDRPFYPDRGARGMTRVAHAAALGLSEVALLSRACDRATAERPAGAPLFWTLGANQTGKAAIAGWRDMLVPALMPAAPSPNRSDGAGPPASEPWFRARPPHQPRAPYGEDVRLWPFHGPLGSLLRPGTVCIAETYPAEALRHLRLRLSGSKRRQSDRAAVNRGLRHAMDGLLAEPETELAVAIETGFGADAAGEDRFDCVLGALCVLNVLAGNRPDTCPEDPWIQRWEGWVLGQTALPSVGLA